MSFNKTLITMAVTAAVSLATVGCSQKEPAATSNTNAKPTVEQAKEYVAQAEKRISDIYEYSAKAEWIAQTHITDDTQFIASKANEEFKLLGIELANGAAQFNDLELDYDTKRKLDKLRLGLTLPAPASKPEVSI